jgi:hypothetical protein
MGSALAASISSSTSFLTCVNTHKTSVNLEEAAAASSSAQGRHKLINHQVATTRRSQQKPHAPRYACFILSAHSVPRLLLYR